MVLQASRYYQLELGDYIRLARHSGAIRRSDAMYALDAKAAIFRRAWRLLPALAAILIPARVLSKKSARLSRSASERISHLRPPIRPLISRQASSCERSKPNLGKLILCLQHPTSNNIPGRAKKIQICPGHCVWGQTLLFPLCE